MSRRCSVCSHPDVRAIDSVLAEGGASFRVLARKYLVSEDSLSRHRKNHLPKIAVQAAQETREYDHHRKLKILETALYTILKRSLEDADDPVALRTHASLLKHYEFELKLGEIEEIKAELAELAETIKEREDIR